MKKEQDDLRKAKEQEDQKLREEINRERVKIVEKLEEEKKLKALEILNALLVKGFKKIGKEKIKDMIDKQVVELKKLWANKRQLLFQVLNLAMIVFSALMIWKGLMFLTKVKKRKKMFFVLRYI